MLLKKSLKYLIAILLVTLLITGCGGKPSGTYVWIDVPVDGLTYAEVQPVKVKGHAAGRAGIAKIELFVDGELWTTIDDPPHVEELASFEAEWLPPGPGLYTIHAVAYSSDGEPSQYDETHISLGMKTPTPTLTPTSTLTPTPVITDTPTPSPTPVSSAAFWADSETVNAGFCTDLHWEAENVKSVVFGGVEQELEGIFEVCLCNPETYTLTVTYTDDSVEKLKANISVVGTCADTTPPSAPNPSSPGNGASLSCRSFQDLGWGVVSDPSGISQYQVKVQRHSGDNNWTNIPGSVFTGISGTAKNISVGCGYYYRWQVLAVDGEGNVGPWSSWSSFVVNLE